MSRLLNFAVGPVQISEEIMKMGAEPVPYFRTSEFSALMKENERLIKKFFFAPASARAVFLTGSGTAAMEAAVMNIFDAADKVLVVNGGGFGARFARLCQIHNVDHTEIKLKPFEPLTAERLNEFEDKGYTALLINIHETSTGVLYDMGMISRFARRNGIRIVADAISSFIADPFNMEELGVGAVITGSQKALALPPGLSIIVMDEQTVKKVNAKEVRSMYFDLSECLKNGERGQTPFTPAVGILLQLNRRLREIDACGIEYEMRKTSVIAEDFREKIKTLPFKIMSETMSNALTPLSPLNGISAHRIFEILKDQYGIWVCPNGGDLADTLFRVGHIGNLTTEDNDTLICALKDMERTGAWSN